MRLMAVFVAGVLIGCPRMPSVPDSGADSGLDGGEGQRCWAPSGTVFASKRPTALASAYFRDGGPCFSASASYRLTGFRDGGVAELTEVDGELRTKTNLNGIYHLETLLFDSWVPVQRLYFARPAEGWLVERTCMRGEPFADSFSCDGRIHFPDGGTGPAADDWLNGDGMVFARLDGGIAAGTSIGTLAAFVAHPDDISWWAGDRAGLATLTSSNILRLFASDGGERQLALTRDAGVGFLFRRAGFTYFSRASVRFGGELCEADAISDAGCVPAYVVATNGDEGWGPSAIGGGDWMVVAYVFDGGWTDDPQDRSFIAPSGWSPDTTLLRAMQSGVIVRSPDQRRALAWHGVRGGLDDMVLFELRSPLVAAGVRSSVAWASWDGGTLVAR